MKKVLFAKYNKTRKPEFQIRTRIYEENGNRFIEKSAARSEGKAHIANMYENYPLVAKAYHKIVVLQPEKREDALLFPYIKGKSLDDVLAAKIGTADFVSSVQEMLKLMFSINPDFLVPFTLTEEFNRIFFDYEGNEPAVTVANVDMLFENVMVCESQYLLIDYEWLFNFPMPVNFIKYRCLRYFYENHIGELAPLYRKNEFITMFGIEAECLASFNGMENRFQQYAHGVHMAYLYTSRYYKPEKKLADLEMDLQKSKKDIELKENHIRNLEAIIRNKDEELANANHIITSAKKLGLHHLFRGSRKVKRGMKRLMRSLVPLDSNRRCYYLKVKQGKLIFPYFENPKVSIIVPAYNQLDYTYACLKSIIQNSMDVPYEVILADDKSTDGTKVLGKHSENLNIARTEGNLGFLRNCNNAAKQARGEYVLFLNNDTQVAPEWLSSLVRLIESDPKIGMVGSKLMFPDGTLQEAGGILWSDGSGWNYGRGDDPEKPQYNYVREVDYISGAAIMLSKKLWQSIGGFDERYAPAYCEDSDLAFAVRDMGYKVMYQPASVVYHFEGVSNGTDLSGGIKQYQVENSKKLYEKWKMEFSKQYDNDGNPDVFAARERLGNRKVIVVVDHYVPTFDQDAGSRTTWQYLKMFIKHGYCVKFIGDNFARQEPYSTALMQQGIEVLYGPQMQQGIFEWIAEYKKHLTFAYLNRPHISIKYIDKFREKTNCKLIYYGHDLHFLRERREYELTGNEENLRQSEYWNRIELSLMQKADVSYYPSYVECEEIKALDQSLVVKDITAYAFEHFPKNINLDFKSRKGLLFVGGFAHKPNTDAVLWFVKEIWPRIKDLPDMEFYIAGSHATPEVEALNGNGIEIKGFVSDDELEALYRSCRMVVAPLRYGAGVKGKIIEALYYGAPVITTTVGQEGIHQADEVMCVTDDAAKWADQIGSLYSDYEQLKEMSLASSRLIKENYSTDKVWAKIRQDFR